MHTHKVDGWIAAGFLAGCAAAILLAVLYRDDTPGWALVGLPFLVGPALGAGAYYLARGRERA